MNPAPFFTAPLDTPADIVRLREHVDVHKDLGYVFAAITRTRHGLRGEVPLIGFCGAPWTLFSYMVEGGGSKTLQKAKTWLFKYPQESKALLTRIADICIDFLVGQVDAGAQVSSMYGPCPTPSPRNTYSYCKCSTRGQESFPRTTSRSSQFRPSSTSSYPFAHAFRRIIFLRFLSYFSLRVPTLLCLLRQQRRLVTMFSVSTGALCQRTRAQWHRRRRFKETLIPTGYMADARRSRMACVTCVQHFV